MRQHNATQGDADGRTHPWQSEGQHPEGPRVGLSGMRLLRRGRRGWNLKPRRARSARADGKQDFFAERILELLELECRLALVAEYLEDGGPALFRHFHAAIFEMDHVHLQRFDLKVPVVAAVWTSQRHERLPSTLPGVAVKA